MNQDQKLILDAITIAVVLGLVVTHVLLATLKRNYVELYQRIGSPHLITNNSIANNMKFLRALYTGELFRLGSYAISGMSAVLFACHAVTLVGLILFPLSQSATS